jgi:hypothetical protein
MIMTFDDDFAQIEFEGGPQRLPMLANGIEWPGPEYIAIGGFIFKKVSHSQIDDETRAELTMLMRGARYVPV